MKYRYRAVEPFWTHFYRLDDAQKEATRKAWKVFNTVSVNRDFGCVEWPGGVDLCSDTMYQTMTGAEAERDSTMALREEKKKR